MTKQEVKIMIMINDKLITLKEQLMEEINNLNKQVDELNWELHKAKRDIELLNVYGGKYV